MTEKQNALKARIHIKNYYILEVEYIGQNVIIYHAEDMKHNREVWLHEYFPESIAKRSQKSDEQFRVYAHPTQSELFESGKIEFQNLYNNLKVLNHPSIAVVYELFESSGTLFVSTKYNANTATLRHFLNNPTEIFSEQKIGMLTLSLVRVFVLLQQRGLQMCLLNPETLLIDNSTQEPLVAYVQYRAYDEQSIQSSIEELGRLLYEIIDKENFKKNESLEALRASRVYSASLCGLVNRMVSDDASKQFKTFEELQTLLQSYQSSSEICEPLVCERTQSKFSSYVGLSSLILVILFVYYIFTQSSVDVKNVTWFDSMRYHLVAYFGNVKGESALGQMYEKGYYVDADIKEAILWYKKAAQQGNVAAQLSLANIYTTVESEKDAKEAFAIYLQLAKTGNINAQNRSGYSYMMGEGTPKDYAKAMHWFTKAQEQGSGYACGAIGWMYNKGYGVSKDLNKALEWYKKGMDRNNTYSKEEYVRLEKYIKKSAETSLYRKGVQEYRLGYQYEQGLSGTKDHKEALQHYTTSAMLGNVKAEFRLAQLYERSKSISRNYEAALHWYKKAAQHGNALAYYRVSQLYRAGHGVQKDDRLALQWCKEAANRGLGVAQGIMGSCYEFGWGTEIDYYQARSWYKRAIASGYSNAKGRLKRLMTKVHFEPRD